jgi:hypothetical protein
MSAWIDEAAAALTAARALPVERGMPSAPSQPGLYAIHAEPQAWLELQLGEPPDERPLYVGKSESSLAGRDIGTHFGYTADTRTTSVTGGSTVRRSLAALMHDSRGFRGVARNMQKPGHFSNYGLTRGQDTLLSEWMRESLRLACWPLPGELGAPLEALERAIFRRLLPPLNLKGVATPWRSQIDTARRVMTAEARRWVAEQ